MDRFARKDNELRQAYFKGHGVVTGCVLCAQLGRKCERCKARKALARKPWRARL
jgi:hypothetical protein